MSIRELEATQQPLEVQQLVASFKLIEQKLKDGTPGLVDAMIDIHKNLLEHEELVELLSDEDIQMLHQGHEKHKQFVLVNQQKSAVSGKKKKLSSDDLNNL